MSFIYLSKSTTENKNICKVGKTTRDPEKRAKEYASGSFKLYEKWRVPEISLSTYETRAHKSLKSYQIPSKEIQYREIFSINAREALPIVEQSIEETRQEIIKQEASNEILQAEINRQQEKKKQAQIEKEKQAQIEKERLKLKDRKCGTPNVRAKYYKNLPQTEKMVKERDRISKILKENEELDKQDKFLFPIAVIFIIILLLNQCSGG